MRAEELIHDPVFQLNLILWMAKEQPPECFQIRPLFHECGFSPLFIEQPFNFPVAISQQIEAARALNISREPEPEVILGNQAEKTAIYFECKAHSFGPESSNSRQARGHLLASGQAFADVYGPLELCLLSYLVPDTDRAGMAACLASLRDELQRGGFSPGNFSIHGLRLEANAIVYRWDNAFAEHLEAAEPELREISVLENITPETDPSPLLLVYTDQDCADEESRNYYRRILSDKLRASMLCDLNQEQEGDEVSLSADRLLHNTTGGMFGYLGRKRQKKMREFVLDNIFGFIVTQWEKHLPNLARLEGQTLTLIWGTAENRENFLEWLEDRKNVFPAERIMESQPNLFDPNP